MSLWQCLSAGGWCRCIIVIILVFVLVVLLGAQLCRRLCHVGFYSSLASSLQALCSCDQLLSVTRKRHVPQLRCAYSKSTAEVTAQLEGRVLAGRELMSRAVSVQLSSLSVSVVCDEEC